MIHFFSSFEIQIIHDLLKVIEVFSLISGLKVNKVKSFVLGINSAKEKVNALANQACQSKLAYQAFRSSFRTQS